MNDTDSFSLESLGWRRFFAKQLDDTPNDLIPARVTRRDINRYHLLSESGPLTGVLRGRARVDAGSKSALPTVGDWVLCSPADASDPTSVVIEQTLDRFSKFSRKEVLESTEEQVVAANVDSVFIVCGLDDNFNPARIERYLLLAWNGGANPVIVLSKADMCSNIDACLEQLAPIAMGTPIHVVSAINDEGLEVLSGYVSEGNTVALLGSSGVGKSTIINALLGYDRFSTGAVRDNDSKGRHTTTFREICMVENGGMLMDTPGMREIQLWSDDATLGASFEDVEALAAKCRFNDCSHESEPGCAVREAIQGGHLEASRLESLRKYQRELEHFAARQDAKLQAEKKQERKKFARTIRNRPSKRDGGSKQKT